MKKFSIIEYLFVTLFCLLLVSIFTFPAVLNLSTGFIGDGGDNYQYAAYQGLASQSIKEGKFPLTHTDFWRYPVGFDFQRSFDFYLSVGIGALINLIIPLPLSYNLSIFILMMLNGLFSYLLFKYLTKSKMLAILGMIIYGFSYYSLARAASHPNLLFVGGFPLFILSFLKFYNSKLSFLTIFLIFGSILLVTLSSAQYLILLLICLFLYYILIHFWDKTYLINIKEKILDKRFILSFGIFILSLLILFSSHILALFSGNLSLINREKVLLELTPTLGDYFLPNPYLKTFLSKIIQSASNSSIEKTIFIGWTEIILFASFFLSKFTRKLKVLIFLLFLIPLLLSFGALAPYSFLFYIFPFNLISETGRYFVIFYLFLTLAILYFLKNLKKGTITTFFIFSIIVLVFMERIPVNFYLSEDITKEDYVKEVAKSDSKAVLDLPLNIYYSPYDLLSLSYKKPIVNGYFHWSADGEKEKSFITQELLSRYSCWENDSVLTNIDFEKERVLDEKMINNLKANGIKLLVIHKDDKFYHSVCKNVRLRLGSLLPFMQTVPPTLGNEEKKIEAKSLEGYPSFNFYFPFKGTFYIDGVYIDPSFGQYLIMKDNFLITSPYSFVSINEKAVEMYPKYSLSEKVEAGTTISIFSTALSQNHTTFSIWYRYIADENYSKEFSPKVEKIFEDDVASIYRIN